MKAANLPSCRTAESWGCTQVDEYADAENELTKVYAITRNEWQMLTDIKESDKGYELEMDLPGFKKDEIKASLENGYLTITAEKGLEKDQKEEEGKKYICRERYSGSCQRTFYVGDEIEQDDIKASFKHGILRLDIPKKQPKPQVEEKKCISIEG